MKKKNEIQVNNLAQELGTERTYTKANISRHTLENVFAIGLGIWDCSTKDIEDVERIVDESYPTKEDIEDAIEDYIRDYTENF